MKSTIAFFVLLSLVLSVPAQNISSNQHRLIHNWQFLRQDLGGIWEAVRFSKPGDPTSVPIWENISLPHCFNAKDAVDPDVNYYQGPGWYRTLLDIKNPYQNGRTLLHFEGAGQKTQVYIGMQLVGEHEGGYDEWTIDITDFIATALKDSTIQSLYYGRIPVSVRCDNSRDLQMIPSDLSDFTLYGGLYRYINLVYVPEIYLQQVHIQALPDEKLKSGKLQIKGKLQNVISMSALASIRITSPEGKIVAEQEIEISQTNLSLEIPVSGITLWSPSKPVLYSISIVLKTVSGEQIYTDHFGFRKFQFEKNGPFYLNNERLLLHGTHRHEDGAGVGPALTEKMIRQEMQIMKDMGVNFIRLGHYQQSRIVLNLCDSLGILVWEEIPWCRGGLGGETYKKQARRMLTNMIDQHYNHPSVIIWGLGNENDWPGDFPEFDKQAIRNFMAELNNISHQLDPSRKTAIRRCDFCKDIVDVYSPSIWAGWYRGKYTEYLQESKKNMEQVDHFLHVEWGGDSHVGRHSESPDVGLAGIKDGNGTDERAGDASLIGGQARVSRDGDWSETYICNLFDWTLKEQEKMPWLTGTAFWIFKDFATPIRPENPVPYVNQKGVVERDLTPKESYYVFQSYWTTKPMIHIYGHSWPIRWGKPGQKRMVKVYSNCSEVELFLNGKSQGVKKRNTQDFPAAGFHWNVEYREGANEIRAVGKSSGGIISDSINQNYVTTQWGTPEKLDLQVVPIDGKSSWIVARMKDTKGSICLDAKNRVEFCLIGDARLADNQGTATGSRKVELTNGMAKIKVVFETDRWVASVKTQGINTAFGSPETNRIDTEKQK
ncbi:MAG TPA: glycoside hydrolase family 2 [Prolixibacteraceae bacterium]|nr:glycoside hydrolase family 2 [Prolixibacteraceae bacterium]